MYRILTAFALAVPLAFACVLIPFAMLADPANAREYYDNSYYRRHDTDDGRYSSHCCYRKIVRHERIVHYERVEDKAPQYRRSDYERPLYQRSYSDRSYYERPNRSSYYYTRPRRDADYSYTSRDYSGYSDRDTSVYSRDAENCGRIPLADGSGGWVWSGRAGCF